MSRGARPPLTAARIAFLVISIGILTGLTIRQLRIRETPAPVNASPSETGVSEFHGETMGASYTVKIAPPVADEASVARAIQDQLDNVDGKMSTYKPDSELSRFNVRASTEPFQFSEDTFEVIQISQRISEQTRGAFDITVGPLVNAWDFGPGADDRIPTDDEVAALRGHVGFQLLTLDPAARTVAKADPAMYCDLSAVAQGYASDRVAQALDALGIEHYMVEISGEVRTKGRNPEGEKWQIGIETPADTPRGVHSVIPLSGMALATSGDYRNFYEKDGVRYSHEIDPRTGRPVQHAAASVTVIHHECVYADAFATAMMVLGPDEGTALAEEIGLPVLFLLRSGDGFEERASGAFRAFLNAPPTASAEL